MSNDVSEDKAKRTGSIWFGIVIMFVGRFIQGISINSMVGFIIGIIIQLGGLALVLDGCYLWTRIKNRHWAFTLWGVLVPIGFLGISLLKDKRAP